MYNHTQSSPAELSTAEHLSLTRESLNHLVEKGASAVVGSLETSGRENEENLWGWDCEWEKVQQLVRAEALLRWMRRGGGMGGEKREARPEWMV